MPCDKMIWYFFFANDVFKGMANAPVIKQEMDSQEDPEPKSGH